jgi:translation initiation factor IF-3
VFIRANLKIKVPKVRCIKPDGEMAGVLLTRDAMRLAEQYGLDLVEVSPNADPPVCRIMDFGKFRYEEDKRARLAKKNQHVMVVKEIKFHANIGDHDFQTKINHALDFLKDVNKVKFSLMFRGRENAHRELGFEVIKRAIKACEGFGVPDMEAKLVGNHIVVMMSPRSQKT